METKNLKEVLQFDEYEVIEMESFLHSQQYVFLIQKYMEAHNMTIETLAHQRTQISKSHIAKIFNGERLMDFEVIAKIQRSLGLYFSITLKSKEDKD